jgi:hypothetical protein
MIAPLLAVKRVASRARRAWRSYDGTFMSQSEKETAYLAEYERYAIGGRARAASGERVPDGTFLSNG